jgi:hypothetical protein
MFILTLVVQTVVIEGELRDPRLFRL